MVKMAQWQHMHSAMSRPGRRRHIVHPFSEMLEQRQLLSRATFQVAPEYETGLDATSVTTADFNADHHPDLAVANAEGVSVFLGNGDGTFGSRTDYAAGS